MKIHIIHLIGIPVIRNEEAYNFSDCLFRMTDDGKILMNYLNIPMSN